MVKNLAVGAYICNPNRKPSSSRSMRSSNPFRPNDRIDTYTARQREGDEDVFDDGDIDGDEDDVTDAGDAFDCQNAQVS
jgi:hypothetical protein